MPRKCPEPSVRFVKCATVPRTACYTCRSFLIRFPDFNSALLIMKSFNFCLSRCVAFARDLRSRCTNDQAALIAPIAAYPAPGILRLRHWTLAVMLMGLMISLLAALPETGRSADTATYLLTEGFEGTGFENPGWTKVGTPDEDYATGALDGLH